MREKLSQMNNPRQNNSELGNHQNWIEQGTELDFSEHMWKGAGSQQKTEKRPTTRNQKHRQEKSTEARESGKN